LVNLLGATEIRALAAELGVEPTKKWGQNFVHDANTVRKIVQAARLSPGEAVVEVGPGLGSLTLGLLEAGHAVTAIEIDPRLAERLPLTAKEHGVQEGSLNVVCEDALAVSKLPVGAGQNEPTALVANLPYNVSVPVLIHLLETLPNIRRVLVMVQSEVGQRLAAKTGSKVYGVPSVKVAWWGDWSLEGTVSRKIFWPEPNVDSVLVGMTAHDASVKIPGTEASIGDEPLRKKVFSLVDAAFGQRRKTLRQALSGFFGSAAEAETACVAAGIDPASRGEQLQLPDFVRLATDSN
jgi:16S rRNA (adenine1518-N6/adenine1519-N6)-dimethyltransferase